jgi:hypothetical protein
MTTAEGPRRFELGEEYRSGQLAPRGTTVVRPATPWGQRACFATSTPCCNAGVRVNAASLAAPPGEAAWEHVTCRGCKWKWKVYLAWGAQRLATVDRDARHPGIRCDRAEWESRGHGTRPYTRRKPR